MSDQEDSEKQSVVRNEEQALEELERQYTLSISEDDRLESFATEDERWEPHNQVRDWIVLAIAIAIWVGFELSFYLLVPGIR